MIIFLGCFVVLVGAFAQGEDLPNCIDVYMYLARFKNLETLNKEGIFGKIETGTYLTEDLTNPERSYDVVKDPNAAAIKQYHQQYTNHQEAFSRLEHHDQNSIENDHVFIVDYLNYPDAGEFVAYGYRLSDSRGDKIALTCLLKTVADDFTWPPISSSGYKWQDLDHPKTIAQSAPANAVVSHKGKNMEKKVYYVGVTRYKGNISYVLVTLWSYWLVVYDAETSNKAVRITRPGRHTKILTSDKFKSVTWIQVPDSYVNGNSSKPDLGELSKSYKLVQPYIYRCKFNGETVLLMENELGSCPEKEYHVLGYLQLSVSQYNSSSSHGGITNIINLCN